MYSTGSNSTRFQFLSEAFRLYGKVGNEGLVRLDMAKDRYRRNAAGSTLGGGNSSGQ